METIINQIVNTLGVAKSSMSDFSVGIWILLGASLFLLFNNARRVFLNFKACNEDINYNIEYYKENSSISVWWGVFFSLAISVGYLIFVIYFRLSPSILVYGLFFVQVVDLILEQSATVKAIKFGTKAFVYGKLVTIVNVIFILFVIKNMFKI